MGDASEEITLEETHRPSGVPGPADRASLFEADLSSRVAALEYEVQVLRECLRQQARSAPEVDEGQVLPTTAYLTADCQLGAEDGFHEMEHDDAGRPYRWTGPTCLFGADIVLDRRAPRTLTIDLVSALELSNIEALRAFCGGEELDLVVAPRRSGNIVSLSATLGPKPPGGRTRIWFAVPRVVSPSERDPSSADGRRLGVAFVALRIA
jgi:hypothetical protein